MRPACVRALPVVMGDIGAVTKAHAETVGRTTALVASIAKCSDYTRYCTHCSAVATQRQPEPPSSVCSSGVGQQASRPDTGNECALATPRCNAPYSVPDLRAEVWHSQPLPEAHVCHTGSGRYGSQLCARQLPQRPCCDLGPPCHLVVGVSTKARVCFEYSGLLRTVHGTYQLLQPT
jgi:hypothetical protein